MIRLLCLICWLMQTTAHAERPIVIAHRGASGYLPEHTLEAKTLAYGMHADFIEQDVVVTRDKHPIVLHDIHLDTVTDVATKYPARARSDGRYYAIDFDLAEIKTLAVHERIDLKSGKRVFPKRFPLGPSTFRIPTLQEEIELIQGLNQSTGRNVGIYPEIKQPAWHRKQGCDISPIVVKALTQTGYRTKDDPVYLQCFDPFELERIRTELKCDLKLIQLIGSNDSDSKIDYEEMQTASGLQKIATYADGIGPAFDQVLLSCSDGQPKFSSLVKMAHDANLKVHPYTFRADALPAGIKDYSELMQIARLAKIDGSFTDFPDLSVKAHQELNP